MVEVRFQGLCMGLNADFLVKINCLKAYINKNLEFFTFPSNSAQRLSELPFKAILGTPNRATPDVLHF